MSIFSTLEPVMAGSLTLFNPIEILNKNNNFYFNTQTLILNDAFSLKGLFNDFHGNFTEQKSDYTAIGNMRYDIGTYMNNSFYIGYAYRKEAMIKTSSDTMQLVNHVSNDLALPIGKKYQIDLNIEGFETHSIVLATLLPLYHADDLDITLGLSAEALYGIQTQNGYASGEAEAIASDDYDFTWNSHYLYTNNYLYDLDVPQVTSYGYTTHVALRIKYNHFLFNIVANDLVGKLYWKNLPYSDVVLSSGNKHYDANGYVVYTPVISGFEGNSKYVQTLPNKWRISGQYSFNNNSAKFDIDMVNKIVLPSIEYAHTYKNDVTVSLNYEMYFYMFGAGMRYKYYYFNIQSNSLIEPSAMKLDFGIHYKF